MYNIQTIFKAMSYNIIRNLLQTIARIIAINFVQYCTFKFGIDNTCFYCTIL